MKYSDSTDLGTHATNISAIDCAKLPFVRPDNRKGARLAGEYLAKQLKPGDKVAILEGVPGAYNGVQRKLGFEERPKK